MTQTAQNPLSLIKGVVSARYRDDIDHQGYVEALVVLERHFSVYEQRLRVMYVPADFPDGDVLLQAAQEGLEQLRRAVDGLKILDPTQDPDGAKSLVASAEGGYGLLAQLQEVTNEKREELEEAYREFEEQDYE